MTFIFMSNLANFTFQKYFKSRQEELQVPGVEKHCLRLQNGTSVMEKVKKDWL